jgi:hypothetical protein
LEWIVVDYAKRRFIMRLLTDLGSNEGWKNSDTSPNSLKDSNVNPKMKIMKEGFGVHSLIHSTLGVRGVC